MSAFLCKFEMIIQLTFVEQYFDSNIIIIAFEEDYYHEIFGVAITPYMEVNRNSIINKDVLKCFLQCDLDGVGVSILVAAIEYQIVKLQIIGLFEITASKYILNDLSLEKTHIFLVPISDYDK